MEILAVDDDPILLHTLQMVLEDDFGEILTATDPNRIEDILSQNAIEVILLDLNFSRGDEDGKEGLAWIKRTKEKYPLISIVVLTAHGFLELAVDALKIGANDFLEKPFSNEKLVATVQAAKNLAQSQMALNEANETKQQLAQQMNQVGAVVLGKSPAMQVLHQTIQKAAQTDASILVLGEHGTGKEMVARMIHQHSARIHQPLIQVDLSATTASLFESVLFGHVKGAFTDAAEDKMGMMETANGGTLLLDEVGDLPLHLQAKLLSALQNRTVTKVGDHRPRPVDIRVISTTHLPLTDLSDPNRFRQDLLYRINTIAIEIPPLRHRPEDIKPLALHFLETYNLKYQKRAVLEKQQLNAFKEYEWPGNVRELQNTIEKMVIMGEAIDPVSAAARLVQQEDNLYELEKEKIREILHRHSGNISRAAGELGIGRNTLYRKMKKYDL
ncbi:MAG: sigma-54 dependent transcriptional regulator [Cytophagales bacterium]|nr:sigma-54 dependent transcriptional regulator [Cytophagales bacterium]